MTAATFLSRKMHRVFVLLLSGLISGCADPAAKSPEVPSVDSVSDSPTVRQAQDTPGDNDAIAGKCSLDPTAGATVRCKGIAPSGVSFAATSKAERQDLDDWLKRLKTNGWTEGRIEFERKKQNPNDEKPKTMLRVAMLEDAAKVKLNELGNRSILMGRIRAIRANAAKDFLYGIDKEGSVDGTYYMVYEGWTGATAGPSDWTIGRYSLYGMNPSSSGKPTPYVARSGTMRLCKMNHSDDEKKYGPSFMTCPGADRAKRIQNDSAVAKALAGRSLLDFLRDRVATRDSTAVEKSLRELLGLKMIAMDPASAALGTWSAALSVLLQNEESAPAWMTCGIGCCTADQ